MAHSIEKLNKYSFDGLKKLRQAVKLRYMSDYPKEFMSDYEADKVLETLKPETGRMGVVVPHGVLFRASSEGKIRKQLIEENLLDTVIGLPEKLFFGTGIPAAILIFKKQ